MYTHKSVIELEMIRKIINMLIALLSAILDETEMVFYFHYNSYNIQIQITYLQLILWQYEASGSEYVKQSVSNISEVEEYVSVNTFQGSQRC